jgi:hypothetical protein
MSLIFYIRFRNRREGRRLAKTLRFRPAVRATTKFLSPSLPVLTFVLDSRLGTYSKQNRKLANYNVISQLSWQRPRAGVDICFVWLAVLQVRVSLQIIKPVNIRFTYLIFAYGE